MIRIYQSLTEHGEINRFYSMSECSEIGYKIMGNIGHILDFRLSVIPYLLQVMTFS